MATRLELERMIDGGNTPDEVVEAMLGSMHFLYAGELLEDTDFFNTPNCDEARRRIHAYRERLTVYKKKRGLVAAKRLTEEAIRALHGDRDYEGLAVYRIDSKFFDLLPGLEEHKLWKQGMIASINRPFNSEQTNSYHRSMEKVLLDNGFTQANLLTYSKDFYTYLVAKTAASSTVLEN